MTITEWKDFVIYWLPHTASNKYCCTLWVST